LEEAKNWSSTYKNYIDIVKNLTKESDKTSCPELESTLFWTDKA